MISTIEDLLFRRELSVSLAAFEKELKVTCTRSGIGCCRGASGGIRARGPLGQPVALPEEPVFKPIWAGQLGWARSVDRHKRDRGCPPPIINSIA